MTGTWWATPEWHGYEAACGLEPGTRERERAAGIPTQVVDLSPPIGELWRGVRKSYHSLINRTLEDARVVPPLAMWDFRTLHIKQAGRITRPIQSWALMARRVVEGKLLLCEFRCEDMGRAYAAFYAHGPYGYYGHAAASAPNLNHALVWLAMRELKLRNVRWLEMGYLDGSSREVFRRGFGGRAMTTDEVDRMVAQA